MNALISGLLVNTGVGLGVLFKVNKNLKENLFIIAILLIIGISFGYISGYVFDIIGY